MLYYEDEQICIRSMQPSDPPRIAQAEREQGWLYADASKYEMRLADEAQGRAITLVAECEGRPVGYVNVYPNARGGAFGGQGYPEIVDFGVLAAYRRRGIGSRLMDTAEKIAAGYADTVYLGVGLHSGYGSAQRMYVKRGYLPDGSGVWYKDAVCTPYADCCNDDELVLYLSKRLK